MNQDLHKHKILIIDDNKTYSRFLSLLLNKHGYIVKLTDNVNDGLELILNENFDVVISDLVMPSEDGVDFLKVMKENPITSSIPIIIVSGYDTKDYAKNLKEMGAFEVFSKSHHKDINILPAIEEALKLNQA